MAEPPLSVNIDAEGLRQLVADMKELEGGKAQVAALRRNLKAAAEPAADQVRQNASWSTRIPAAVGVRVAFTARNVGVTVFVNRKKAPGARPIENDSAFGSFTHPVFGHGSTSQAAKPFFFDQIEQHLPAVERAASEAIEEAARTAGFR